MYCTKDCGCSLCRELRGYKPSPNGKDDAKSKASAKAAKQFKRPAPRPPPASTMALPMQLPPAAPPSARPLASSTPSSLFGRLNENFILRRRVINSLKTFQPKSLHGSHASLTQHHQPAIDELRSQMRHAACTTPSPTPIHEVPSSLPCELAESPAPKEKPNHKVVIYFGDSMLQRGNRRNLMAPAIYNSTNATTTSAATTTSTTTTSEKLSAQRHFSSDVEDNGNDDGDGDGDIDGVVGDDAGDIVERKAMLIGLQLDDELPPYIERIEDGVINIKIEGNYRSATALVARLSQPTRAVVKQHVHQHHQHVNDADSLGGNSNGNSDSDSDSESDDNGSGEQLKRDRDDDVVDATSIATAIATSKPTTATTSAAAAPVSTSAPIATASDSCDWSFVQEWRRQAPRRRPSAHAATGFSGLAAHGVMMTPLAPGTVIGAANNSNSNATTSGSIGAGGLTTAPPVTATATSTAAAVTRTTLSSAASVNGNSPSGRIQCPALTAPAMRIAKELAQRPALGVATPLVAATATQYAHNNSNSGKINHNVGTTKAVQPHRSIAGPARLTVQSTPVKAQPPMLSGSLTQHQPHSQSHHQQQQQPAQQQLLSPQQQQQQQQPPHYSNKTQDYNVIATAPTAFGDLNGSLGIPHDVSYHQRGHLQPQQPHAARAQQQHSGHNGGGGLGSSSTRTHHHDIRALQRVQEYYCCHSSSDENRSSGHHSWSDGHGSSSPGGGAVLGPLPEDRLAAGVTNRNTRARASNTNHARVRHRAVNSAASTASVTTAATTTTANVVTGKAPWTGNGLDDIKQAIQQLTMRSQTSTSTYSSLSAGSESSEPVRRLGGGGGSGGGGGGGGGVGASGRYASLETVNTNVTSAADEFVWVDSHNRLVELQHPPWSSQCIMRVLHNGRCKSFAERVSVDTLPRLSYLLQRALVRIAREVQRLSANYGLCSKQEVASAFKVVLCPVLADSCIKACLRAATMFAVAGDSALKQSKSARAGLQLPVGRFHRWMTDARLGRFIHEYGAVYLCAGMENLLEEILLQCFPNNNSNNNNSTINNNNCSSIATDGDGPLTANALEQAISGSGDLWGLLQPFAHLNAGRTASGVLTMPRWASQSSLGTSTNTTVSSTATNSSSGTHQSKGSANSAGNAIGMGISIGGVSALEHCLLTTCVGSVAELRELTQRVQLKFPHVALSNTALNALFYFMRCSQLEHTDASAMGGTSTGGGGLNTTANGSGSGQELCYERAYVVLPPLMEWLRVASAHAEYRNATLADKDDIMQAARLLLPGVDCPRRSITHDEELPTKKTHQSEDTAELGKRATIALAFKLMLTGRAELLAQASQLLPPTTRYDTPNHVGLTALMVASVRNDEVVIQALLDAGCDPNVEVPSLGQHNQFSSPAIHPDTQHWTAVTFAASRGNYNALRLLLERGGRVEGGARISEDRLTLTPLQVACGIGSVEVVSLLLAHGANAFLSTQPKDAMCSAGSAQRGCFSAISVAAAHGQRASLRKLLSHPMSPGTRDVLSLEEMLAEGDAGSSSGSSATGGGNGRGANTERGNDVMALTLSKTQIKCLQEAMYHSAENNHLDITIELRTLGVPWTLHCWMHALNAAHDLRLDTVIDQLLQDFLQVCPDDYSAQFVTECLPLLFNIFRYSKNEGTTLLLADIFATCYGWEQIKPIKQTALQPVNTSRIDPKFVNNPELSDVTFKVEGKIFYGHKIVLVTASPRFQSMLLSSKLTMSSSSNESSSSNTNSNTNNATPTVQINDIRYSIFQLVMQYLYSGGCAALDLPQNDVLELMAAASFFQLEGLLRYTEARCAAMIDIENVVAMYIHAKVYNASKLLEYCQGFLLQNMVSLLTYDDSVKRLLFAKKIPHHDVVAGLLQCLQQRIKQRKPVVMGNFRQQLSSPPPNIFLLNNATTAGAAASTPVTSPSASAGTFVGGSSLGAIKNK